jgi:hypothetical protein
MKDRRKLRLVLDFLHREVGEKSVWIAGLNEDHDRRQLRWGCWSRAIIFYEPYFPPYKMDPPDFGLRWVAIQNGLGKRLTDRNIACTTHDDIDYLSSLVRAIQGEAKLGVCPLHDGMGIRIMSPRYNLDLGIERGTKDNPHYLQGKIIIKPVPAEAIGL